MMKESWVRKGFVHEPVAPGIKFEEEIRRLASEKNAVILAHYYQQSEIQEVADFVGDSLDLSRKAAETKADIILFAGVHFMAETAKILAPGKKVLIPDLNAGCSLADSCPPDQFAEFRRQHPDHLVVTYVNTSAAIKALSDICCTSANALSIIQQIPEDQKIIFAPDRNLGNYINSLTGRNMLVWDGACHVHEEFSLEKILLLKNEYPEAKVIAHPECQRPILIVADFIGSTSALLKYTAQDSARAFIVATESGILHQMKKASPDKIFIPAPPKDSTCACNDCSFMKLHNLKKMYLTLLYEWPEVTVEEEIRVRAEVPIRRMLEMS
ncbi:MAG: quinolinate synthase NadA [Bacteroidales bacterium]